MGPLANNDGFRTFLERVATEPRNRRFVARNFLLDPGIVAEREASYRARGASAEHTDFQDWQIRHEAYLNQEVFLAGDDLGPPRVMRLDDPDRCPETFRLVHPRSPYGASDQHLDLIRVEDVRFIARILSLDPQAILADAETCIGQGNTTEAWNRVSSYLRAWARRIQLRPVFAAYWEDARELFGTNPANDRADWADRLRDRLGLAHLDPAARGTEIPILVFRYPVSALPYIHETGPKARPLVAPTVLDGRFSEAFCPAPLATATGHTLHLNGKCEHLCREVLHPPLSFEASHVWRTGAIARAFDADNLEVARGLHLQCLQRLGGADTFGNDTDADLF